VLDKTKEPVKILPEVQAWSDIVFVEWQTQAQNRNRDIKGLKYIFRYQIVTPETVAIIEEAASGKKNLPWPGVTISMTDEYEEHDRRGMAILGTPHGTGVAYLLSTHKAQFGQRIIESVQVWSDMKEKTYLIAIFIIGPVTPP
jgi:hypothetical protein